MLSFERSLLFPFQLPIPPSFVTRCGLPQTSSKRERERRKLRPKRQRQGQTKLRFPRAVAVAAILPPTADSSTEDPTPSCRSAASLTTSRFSCFPPGISRRFLGQRRRCSGAVPRRVLCSSGARSVSQARAGGSRRALELAAPLLGAV